MLPKKRERPRRNEGRVQHKRIRPKESAPPTAEEKRHLARIASMPCLTCGRSPVEVHHVFAKVTGGRMARSHKCVTPLCPECHRTGSAAVHALGHGGFFLRHGVDLYAEATRLWDEREGATQVTCETS